jgi:hypothetical protein
MNDLANKENTNQNEEPKIEEAGRRTMTKEEKAAFDAALPTPEEAEELVRVLATEIEAKHKGLSYVLSVQYNQGCAVRINTGFDGLQATLTNCFEVLSEAASPIKILEMLVTSSIKRRLG